MNKINAKITKETHSFKCYASSHNIVILIILNLQLKKEKAIRKGHKFVTKLVLEIKKMESDDKTLYTTFHLNSTVETIINESDT